MLVRCEVCEPMTPAVDQIGGSFGILGMASEGGDMRCNALTVRHKIGVRRIQASPWYVTTTAAALLAELGHRLRNATRLGRFLNS